MPIHEENASQQHAASATAETVIRMRADGPFIVEGPAVIVDSQGNRFAITGDKPAIALCRCGQSQKKPFCDGSHRTCQFISNELAR